MQLYLQEHGPAHLLRARHQRRRSIMLNRITLADAVLVIAIVLRMFQVETAHLLWRRLLGHVIVIFIIVLVAVDPLIVIGRLFEQLLLLLLLVAFLGQICERGRLYHLLREHVILTLL